MFKDNDYTLLTPTRFLMDSTTNNDWNFSTASSSFYINESNPFQDQKQQDMLTMPPSPETTVTIHPYAPNTPPTPPQQARSPKITKTNERKHLLEKNRQAAYRCRQKKKRWVQELEEKSDFSERRNKELQEQVTQLRDESVYLRNLLLTHGNCQCKVVQDYLKRTSAQLSSQADIGTPYNSNTLFSTSQQHYNL